jgi:hypothetical protein
MFPAVGRGWKKGADYTGSTQQGVEIRSGERETRQKPAKKRSLYAINEHFEPVFNAVSRRMSRISTPC